MLNFLDICCRRSLIDVILLHFVHRESCLLNVTDEYHFRELSVDHQVVTVLVHVLQ